MGSATMMVGATEVPAMKAAWRTNSPNWNLPVKMSVNSVWMVRHARMNWLPPVAMAAEGWRLT